MGMLKHEWRAMEKKEKPANASMLGVPTAFEIGSGDSFQRQISEPLNLMDHVRGYVLQQASA
jgi:hypothetical protein